MRRLRQVRDNHSSALALRLIGVMPGHAARLALLRALGARIGQGCTVMRTARFYEPANISLGDHTIVNDGCVIHGAGGVALGNNVNLGLDVAILSGDHDVSVREFPSRLAAITVGDHVTIGSRAILLKGVTIGRGAVIAAGAVVTRSVAARAVVAGAPAREIAVREGDLQELPIWRPRFL